MNTQFAVCCYNNESTVFFGSIFYKVSVVGNNTYSIYTKMGVGKRPDATFWETHNDGWNLYIVKILYGLNITM